MEKEKVNKVDINALEQEVIILRKQNAELQSKVVPEFENAMGDRVMNEVKKIRQKGKSTANSITVVERNDHQNVCLWTKWADRIGPLHPDNAIQTLYRFADIGVALSADKPTGEQVKAFYDSPEGKKFLKIEHEKREVKMKSKRSGQMERLCEAIAKMQGTTVEAINHILKPTEVKK